MIDKKKIVYFNANCEDLDQTPRSAASDLGLHGLPQFFLWDAKHKWIKFLGVKSKLWLLPGTGKNVEVYTPHFSLTIIHCTSFKASAGACALVPVRAFFCARM